jgi:hypothetical protein
MFESGSATGSIVATEEAVGSQRICVFGTLRPGFLEERHRQAAFLRLHSRYETDDLDRGAGKPGWICGSGVDLQAGLFAVLEVNPLLQLEKCAAFTHIEDFAVKCRSLFLEEDAPKGSPCPTVLSPFPQTFRAALARCRGGFDLARRNESGKQQEPIYDSLSWTLPLS